MTIEEILNELEIEIAPEGHHHRTQNYYQTDCPRCSKGTQKYRLGIHKSGAYAVCWICGHVPILDALVELTGQPYSIIKELLKDIHSDFTPVLRTKGKLILPKGIQPLKELPLHQKYLRNRGYNWRKLEKLWRIQGIPLAVNLSWRIFIPITFQGDVVSWTTRSISKQEGILRYISASPEQEAIAHKTLLYGEEYARQAIIITEGPFDAMRIGPGAVATLGIGFSTAQVQRMIRFPIRAILFDSELEAQKRAKKLMEALVDFPGETMICQLETGKDAGEADEEEIRQIRKEILT